MKIVTSIEYSSLMIKDVSETFLNEEKKQKDGWLDMLLGTLGASLLCVLAGKGVITGGDGFVQAGERVIITWQNFLMPPHPLITFEIQRYYQNKPKFNCVCLFKKYFT